MNTKDTTTIQLQPPQLIFLLEDLTRKLDHVLLISASKKRTFLKTKSNKSIGFSQLEQYTPLQIAKQSVKLLSALCEHLERASQFFQDLINDNDGVVDGPGHNSPEAQQMASVFQLLLQAISSILSWTGFIMPENKDLFKEALSTIASRLKSAKPTQTSLQDLLGQSYQYMENWCGSVPDLSTAFMLMKILLLVAERSQANKLITKTAKLSEDFLKREWFGADGQREKGAKHNENLQTLVKIYITYSEDKLAAIEAIMVIGVPELLESDKNGCSSTYRTLTRSSFIVFYRVCLVELVNCSKTILPGKQADSTEEKLDKLMQWNLAVRIFHILVNLIKAFDQRVNLSAILKYGRQFIDNFLRLGMPVLDCSFRAHKDDVTGLLKNLQLSTRALHHMCGHSKIMKDISLTNHIPLLKKCLESFVYRVKAMLTMNKCLEAFWIGNLKNRDLQGEEILSQVSQTTQITEQDTSDTEDLPDDDDDSEVEMDTDSNEGNSEQDKTTQDSYSACY